MRGETKILAEYQAQVFGVVVLQMVLPKQLSLTRGVSLDFDMVMS